MRGCKCWERGARSARRSWPAAPRSIARPAGVRLGSWPWPHSAARRTAQAPEPCTPGMVAAGGGGSRRETGSW
ncbi:MAG: hypothetical protein B7X31_14195 [Thiomonas sp. 13-66-29]|nr:MAG: hypothetical protein B7X31_14195 [Thiomonas sp. 13-66-29]